MRIDVVTLFPDMFPGFLDHGLPRIARYKGLIEVHLTNFRDFASDRRGTVDDRPFGGGAGMLLMCEPVVLAVESLEHGLPAEERPLRVLFSPQGQRLDQPLVEQLAREPRLTLICGHYEGFDERIRTTLDPLEISVGDYVLSGGELPAMTLIDAVARLQDGAVGDPDSVRDDSFSNSEKNLEYAQFTRPRVFREQAVPEVLLSGNHAAIKAWRDEQARAKTQTRRPDLLAPDQG